MFDNRVIIGSLRNRMKRSLFLTVKVSMLYVLVKNKPILVSTDELQLHLKCEYFACKGFLACTYLVKYLQH